mgnify:CR=1 FL=1
MIANTEAFGGYLDRLGVAYKYIERQGKSDLILLKYRMERDRNIEVMVFFDQDNENVSFRCYTGIRPEKSNYSRAMSILNDLNMSYRGIKYYLNDEIIVAGDFIVGDDSTQIVCYKYLECFVNVINETYDNILQVLFR